MKTWSPSLSFVYVWVEGKRCEDKSAAVCAQCSSTCAGGSQRRVVVCQDENGYPASDCVERIKPDEQRACESGPCPQWAYGSWGEVRANHLSLSVVDWLLLFSILFLRTRFRRSFQIWGSLGDLCYLYPAS